MAVWFHNTGVEPLRVSHERAGSRQVLATAVPQSKLILHTFVGHRMVVEDPQGRAEEIGAENAANRGDVLCEYQERDRPAAEGGGKESRIWCRNANEEQGRYSGENWDRTVNWLRGECIKNLEGHPEDAAHFCHKVDYQNWFYAQCRFEFTEEEFHREFTPQLAGNKAAVDRRTTDKRFTEHGFSVASLPKELFQEIQDYWRTHRVSLSRPENHPKLNPVVSGCETDTWMLDLPWDMKMKVKDVMLPLVAEWSGQREEDLEFTAIYGIRMYRKGAKLHVHRDHMETHVLSAIMEIGQLEFGQSEVEEEGADPQGEQWPLVIQDHNGTYVSVPNSVGQLIFYESWSCPHGRPTVFEGREMANLFVHYAPKNWQREGASGPFKDSGLRPRGEL